jgi:hypothetical protein
VTPRRPTPRLFDIHPIAFRLFFRCHSATRIIVDAWSNDETKLRKTGARSAPSTVFQREVTADNPPGGWAPLHAGAQRAGTTEPGHRNR